MNCTYCKKPINGTDNAPQETIIFCDSICVWMKFEGEQMLKDGKFPDIDRG